LSHPVDAEDQKLDYGSANL
jgi:hypothetical protein